MRAFLLILVVAVSACAGATVQSLPRLNSISSPPILEIPAPDSTSPPLKFLVFGDHQFALIGDFKFVFTSSHEAVRVPSGFVTDFASIPKVVAPVFRKEPHPIPGLVHDFLYWTWRCSRKESDRMFEVALDQLEARRTKATAMFLGLRIGGEGAWKENQRDRENRLPRIIPAGAMNFPTGTSWRDYRIRLRDNDQVPLDDLGPQNPGYCKTGQKRW